MEFTTKKELFEILKNDFFKTQQKKASEEEFKVIYEGVNNFINEIGIDFCISFIETMEKGNIFNWEMIKKTPPILNTILFYHILVKLNEYFEGVEND